MKPFSLEEYIKNPSTKIVTRDGKNVRIICTDAKGNFPIIALVETHNGTETVLRLKENGYFDAPREFDFINVSYKERDKYYFNQRSVDELDLSLHPIDGLSIAMGAFVINATAKGKVEKKSDGGYLITVDQIGLYAKDMFNFAGANNLYLFWSYKDKDFSTNGIAGTLDDNYHWLTNEDFNLFRKNTNNGEDFLIFSEVEKQSLSAKIHNK